MVMPDIHFGTGKFEFGMSPRVVFGRGRRAEIGRIALDATQQEAGRRAWLLTGASFAANDAAPGIEDALEKSGFTLKAHCVSGEPLVSHVDHAVELAREFSPDVIIAVGGGSVLDTGKAVAGLLANGGSSVEYLEGPGTGKELKLPSIPFIAMPTTAGTGSEVTKNAVITADDRSFKKSMRSPHLFPRFALVDSELTHSLPERTTVFTAMDALTQLIESYTSAGASVVTDSLALTGIRLVARSLQRVMADGSDGEARDQMALAALLSGICLANAGLGAVHGLVAPLGARFPVPHGAGCAALLAPVVEANTRCLQRGNANHPVLNKYRTVADVLVQCAPGTGKEPHQVIRRLVADVRIPGLRNWGVTANAIEDVVRASRGSSMRFNPVVLEDSELETALEAAL